MNKFALLVGLAFGFLITAARLSDYDVIHDMLLLAGTRRVPAYGKCRRDRRPLLLILKRLRWKTPSGEVMALRRAAVRQPRNVMGAFVFGTGWAIAGTCPGPAIAMTVGGNVLGLVVMAGLVSGIFSLTASSSSARVLKKLAQGRAPHLRTREPRPVASLSPYPCPSRARPDIVLRPQAIRRGSPLE